MQNGWSFATTSSAGRIVALMALCSSAILQAQTLKITEPKDGTLVRPGQTLIVMVDTVPARAFRLVTLAGDDAVTDPSQILSAPPYRFSIKIPASITPRCYLITAGGVTEPGHGAFSDPVHLLVEYPGRPLTLEIDVRLPEIRDIGDQSSIQVVGNFADAKNVYLTESSYIRFTSDAPNVATVTSEGLVKATGRGAATITVNYQGVGRDGSGHGETTIDTRNGPAHAGRGLLQTRRRDRFPIRVLHISRKGAVTAGR